MIKEKTDIYLFYPFMEEKKILVEFLLRGIFPKKNFIPKEFRDTDFCIKVMMHTGIFRDSGVTCKRQFPMALISFRTYWNGFEIK